jgi:MFS family permease
MFFTTPGQSDTFSIFMNSFIEDLGRSRTAVSSLFSIATLLAGACMFLVGRFIDRFGSKRIAILSAAILGVACFINSIATNQIVLFLGFFLGRFAGKGALSLSAETVAPQWFDRRRAFAIMLVSLGGTAGGSIFPLLNNHLIQTIGWRAAWRVLAGGTWIIFIPIAFLLFVGRPEDVGLRVDGRSASKEGEDENVEEPEEHAVTQKDAIRTVVYWILAFSLFQAAMNGTGITLHFVSIFEQANLTMTFAARIMSIGPIIGLCSSLLLGLVLDRVKRPKYVLASACSTQVAALILLAFLRGAGMAYCYAALAGFASRAIFFCNGLLTARIILGVTAAINVVGTAIGPIVFGAAYDLVGGYRGILLISATFPLIACVSAFFIREPRVKIIGNPA